MTFLCINNYYYLQINTEEIPQFYPNRASLAVIPANLVLTIQEYFTQIKGKLFLGKDFFHFSADS